MSTENTANNAPKGSGEDNSPFVHCPSQLVLPGMDFSTDLPDLEPIDQHIEPTVDIGLVIAHDTFEPIALDADAIARAVEESVVKSAPISTAEVKSTVVETAAPVQPEPTSEVESFEPPFVEPAAASEVVAPQTEDIEGETEAEPKAIEAPVEETVAETSNPVEEQPAEKVEPVHAPITSTELAEEPQPTEQAQPTLALEPPTQPVAETKTAIVETKPTSEVVAKKPEPAAQTPAERKPAETTVAEQANQSATEPAAVPVDKENQFAQLDLRPDVMKAVVQQGYDTPTEIQARIIPHMLNGRDVLAQSQTGTGKTAAFALPVLSRIQPGSRKPQVLVLAPTRELAMQVASAFDSYGANVDKLRVTAIYGGSDYGPQLRALKRGVDVVVGTPGRVIDHIKKGTLDIGSISCLVLDEADEMLNMGFLEDVQFVLEHAPESRQVALFSATLPPAIRGIAQHYLHDPARITIKSKTVTAESIRQRAIFTIGREKLTVLQRILEVEETDGVIVFVKTKESTIQVAEDLVREGLSAVAINGDMPQKVRERTIRQFKNGRLNILVATDVAARGLDVERVSHVFNYDLPHGTESYIHRIGRTGRAGRKGEAIIFLTRSERHKLRNIERATRQPLEIADAPTAQDINAMRVQRYKERITQTIESADLTFFTEMLQTHAAETGQPMETIAAAVAQMGLGRKSFFLKKDKPKKKVEYERNERGSRDKREHKGKRERRDREVTQPDAGMARYRIGIGWRDGVKPGNIVGAIANGAGIDGKAIGHINIQHSYATVDLPEDLPLDIRQELYHTRVVGRQMRLALESEYRSGDRDDNGSKSRSDRPRKYDGKKKFNKRKSGGASFGGNKKRKFKDK